MFVCTTRKARQVKAADKMVIMQRGHAMHSTVTRLQQDRPGPCRADPVCIGGSFFGSGVHSSSSVDVLVHTTCGFRAQALLVGFACYCSLTSQSLWQVTVKLASTFRCCPFIPHIWRAQPWLRGQCMRLGFETTYAVNVLRRLLTLPVRPHLPAFYIVGFPVSSLLCHLSQRLCHAGSLDGNDTDTVTPTA